MLNISELACLLHTFYHGGSELMKEGGQLVLRERATRIPFGSCFTEKKCCTMQLRSSFWEQQCAVAIRFVLLSAAVVVGCLHSPSGCLIPLGASVVVVLERDGVICDHNIPGPSCHPLGLSACILCCVSRHPTLRVNKIMHSLHC